MNLQGFHGVVLFNLMCLLPRDAGEVGREAGRRGYRASARSENVLEVGLGSLGSADALHPLRPSVFAKRPATSPAVAVEEFPS